MLFVGTVVGWAIFLAAMVLAVANAPARGNFVDDYRVRVRPLDVLAAALGVAHPARRWSRSSTCRSKTCGPTRSPDDKLSENAKDLVDRATGRSMVLLVLMVCVGAPIVEELAYRGLLRGSLANRLDRDRGQPVQPGSGVARASAFFALIHFRPVEYPGLFVAGLVFGACALLGRPPRPGVRRPHRVQRRPA